MKQFYYEFRGKLIGPYDSHELRAAVLDGSVQPNTIIQMGKDGRRVPASKLRGLFDNGVSVGSGDGDHANKPSPSTNSITDNEPHAKEELPKSEAVMAEKKSPPPIPEKDPSPQHAAEEPPSRSRRRSRWPRSD